MPIKIDLRYLILILVCLATKTGESANYYFSSTKGNDYRTSIEAQNRLTPWQTITKLNAVMRILQPGDSVLFKRGEVFYGALVITKSGNATLPLVFADYGTGDKPEISGLTKLSNWTNMSHGLWEADVPTGDAEVNNLLINNCSQQMGRYPNITEANRGYLKIESHFSNKQITDNQLSASPDWTGADVVIRKNHWIIDKALISRHSGNTLSYKNTTNYIPKDNWGYFIQNHPLTLDAFGEWYYNPQTKKMLLFAGTINPLDLNIVASTVATLVTVVNQKYISFENLVFKGSNTLAVNLSNSRDISITNSDILFSGINGISATRCSNLLFENNVISNTKNNALNWYCNSSIVRNNSILNTGLIPGAGQNGDDTYQAVIIKGNSNKVDYNTIDSTGYTAIRFEGDSALIKNNVVSNFLLTKDDGGGIYTWNGYAQAVIPKVSQVIGNIVMNSKGSPEGTDMDYSPVFGIYMDGNSSNVEIEGNTVANIKDGGIFLNIAHEIKVTNNTFYNNGVQFSVVYGNSLQGINKNLIFKNNILFSKKSDQRIFNLQTSEPDVNNFGEFDDNYYCRPANEDLSLGFNNNSYKLSQWQKVYLKDQNSKTAPVQIPDYSITYLSGNNLYSNGKFNENINRVTTWSPENNCSATWEKKGKMDKGSLKFAFSSFSGKTNRSLLIINVGTITAGKKYILRFSLRGEAKDNKCIGTNLRQSLEPYGNLTPFQNCNLSNSRTENELIFSPTVSEGNASIQFEIEEADSTLWLDNVELFEVNVAYTNPDDFIRFEYNATQQPKVIELTDIWVDVKNNSSSGSVTLQPFTSIILMKKETEEEPAKSSFKPTNEFTVFPNPARGTVTVQMDSPSPDKVQMVLLNLLGQRILTDELPADTISRSFNIESLCPGVYVLAVYGRSVVTKTQLKVSR